MPTDCVWFDLAEHDRSEPLPVGACYFDHGWCLSEHYKANVVSVRQPIMVNLPVRGDGRPVWWCIDSFPDDEPGSHWDVTVDLATLVVGQKPDITVEPSINAEGLYHGCLTHGVLSDDSG